jgi:hypothetical protein
VRPPTAVVPLAHAHRHRYRLAILGGGGFMRWMIPLYCVVVGLGGCGSIKQEQLLIEATDKTLTVPVGGTLTTINKQKSLPNAFGKADVFQRTTNAGMIKLIYKGRAPDGGALVEQIDIDVHSTASTMSRSPGFASSNSSASVVGTPYAIAGSANSSSFAMAPVGETNIVLPPTAVAFKVPTAKR